MKKLTFKSLFSIHHSLFFILYSLFFILHLLFSILYSGVSIANAEDTIDTEYENVAVTSLSITPSIHEEILKLGETITREFEIRNNSNIPLPITSYVRVFDASDEFGGVTIDDNPELERLSPVSWIQIENPDFILQPNLSRVVIVNFSPPADLTPGGHYATLFFEPLIPESYLSSSSVNVGSRIGALLFLISPGSIDTSAELEGGLPKKLVLFEDDLIPDVKISNNGNIHLRPKGLITYENVITGNIKEIEIEEFTVLPLKTRVAMIKNDKFIWPGIYKYSINIVYGNEQTTISDYRTVYYLQLIYMIVIMLLAGLSVLFFWHKPRKRIIRAVRLVVTGK